MFKLLFIAGVLYYAYRFFIATPELDERREAEMTFRRKQEEQKQARNTKHEDEYVDYEEVD